MADRKILLNHVPFVAAVLQLVKRMIDAGLAVAVMGNHELNALAYLTPDPSTGGYYRPHSRENWEQIHHSYEGMAGGLWGREWRYWVSWFKTLPLFLELEGLRLVHACWDPMAVERLRGCSFADDEFLHRALRKGTQENQDVEQLLKGLELPFPRSAGYADAKLQGRVKFRARWFARPRPGQRLDELIFPSGQVKSGEHPVTPELASEFLSYPADAPPLLIGHYSKPSGDPVEPELSNMACLDYGVAKGGPLVAYCWDGERSLSSSQFVCEG